jgi:hypothetical protein
MCPKDELLSAYIDREIESPYDKQVSAHLHTCERCRRRLESLQAVSSRLLREEIPGLEAAAFAVERRLAASLADRRQNAFRQAPAAGPQHRDESGAAFWHRRIAVPLPMLAAGVAALFVLVASLFFFLGRSGNELQTAKNELENMKTVHVYYPVQDKTRFLEMINDKSINQDVVFELPENDRFSVIGQPEVIYVNERK